MDIELKNAKRHPTKKVQGRKIIKRQERDKRHETRKETAQSLKTTVKIPLPFPKGVIITKEVTDISDQGLSFKMTREEGFLLPGTAIKDLVVYYNGTKAEKPSAEVMYAVPDTENGCFKVGIKFIGATSKRSALGRQAMNPAVRPIRYDLAKMNQQQKLVSFADHDGQQYSGILKNISPYGLAFELEKSENAREGVLKLSDIIDRFQVLIGKETVYNGSVTIANLRAAKDKVIVGVSFRDKSVDINKVVSQDPESANTREAEWATTFLKIKNVQPAFKALVADKRYFLEAVKTTLDEEERKACNQGMIHKKMIEESVLARFEQPVYAYLDRIMKDFSKLVCDFDEEQHAYHREYFQKQLGNLIWQAPFVKRCYLKPLGYAGDYEMMDMIYRDPSEGDTLFAKLLNKYYCYHIPPAQASRNRIPYLLKKIEQTVERKVHERKKARILSIACGPANEVVEFMRIHEASNQAEVDLVDIEPEALYFSQERILGTKAESQRNTRVNIYYLPLQQLLKENFKLNQFDSYDLIYSAGLFEYLSDDVSKRTITTLYKLLNKDGMLIIGNFGPGNDFTWGLEYGAEWYLIYRTQAELIKLAQDAVGAMSLVRCEEDSTKINNFLVVRR